MSDQSMLLNKTRKTIERFQLLEPGARVVVAVSGGPDSVALLHILLKLAPEYSLHICVAHLDHGIRREESTEDARFVEALASRWHLPFVIARRDVPALAASRNLSMEEAARLARYEFLFNVAREQGGQVIAVGHQADDQAETVLMHLLRGSGPAGLGGMAPRRGTVIRPLLYVSRQEILAYLETHGLTSCLDSSNTDPSYLRNRVRLELLPLLKDRFNPRVAERLLDMAETIRDENAYLEELAAERFRQALLEKRPGMLVLDCRKVSNLAVVVQRRVVRFAWASLSDRDITGRPLRGLEFRHVEDLLRLLLPDQCKARGTAVSLPGAVEARREHDSLVLSRPVPDWLTSRRQGKGSTGYCLKLVIPGETVLPGKHQLLIAELHCLPPGAALQSLNKASPPPGMAMLDWNKVKPPLWVRTWRAGDSFRPLGAGGKRKLHDFFIDARIPRWLRPEIPLVFDQEGIIWVAGMRLDDRCRIWETTREVLCLNLRDKTSLTGPAEL